MADIFNMLDTWNAGATVFTGIKLSVTDTASAAGSLLMDLQVGGVSRFSVTKAGRLTVADTTQFASPSIAFPSNISFSAIGTNLYAHNASFSAVRLSTNTTPFVSVNGSGYFGFASGDPSSADPDTRLFRDAANTLAQRNGVNAQAFNLYNTYTDASNYERGFMKWVGNTLRIGTDALGTGSARSVEFQPGGTTQFAVGIFGPFLPATGLLQWSGRSGLTSPADGVISMRNAADNGGSALQFREQTAPAAPATDNVRIYAEDDGAGKTRLMARFATGAAVQIAIEP